MASKTIGKPAWAMRAFPFGNQATDGSIIQNGGRRVEPFI
jgi:hypothetical protein